MNLLLWWDERDDAVTWLVEAVLTESWGGEAEANSARVKPSASVPTASHGYPSWVPQGT